jgi:hypothetical protein
MGSRDPSQSVGPSNTSPLAVPEAELINREVKIRGQEEYSAVPTILWI